MAVLIGVFAITYFISLNMENHYIILNTKWLSNDFLFAISGGTFASLVVVLVCEIIKYRQIKIATEGALFSYLANLYGQFLIIKGNCTRTLKSHNIVSDNLIQSTCDNSMMLVDYINGIDYSPYCKNNIIKDILDQFKKEKYSTLKNVLISFANLRIAIREDSIILLQQGKRDIVTSDCRNTQGTLNKIKSQTSTILIYLDQIISQIDNGLQNKYNWQSLKKTMDTYQDNLETKTLADYMNEDLVVF
ncbi:MAG: hypothetical protein IJU35_01920 [Paludibacteraceae bacterium]|nr:hypothetical protein [Paludibacteraceae bacterium]